MTDRVEIGSVAGADGLRRCGWSGSALEYIAYHDQEWGRPVTDDVRIFEKICLEGFQSGLSWLTILRKRDAFRSAFAGFVPETVARLGPRDVERLLANSAIVRHRGKIEATIANAAGTLRAREQYGSLAALVWLFEPSPSGRRAPRRLSDIESSTKESDALSKELRRLGFRFVGPTTIYAAMQSLGLVNDHLVHCFARSECSDERKALRLARSAAGRLQRRRSAERRIETRLE